MLPMLFVAKAGDTITVDSVGKLAILLPDSTRFTIAELKISGPLNGQDLKLLQQIVTRTKTNKKNPAECLVTSVDLSDAIIVEGKDGLKTQNGVLPANLFAGAKNLQTVILPQTIIGIGKSCFEDCESLTDFTLPESLRTIEANAFEDCKAITTMTIPTNIRTDAMKGFIMTCSVI